MNVRLEDCGGGLNQQQNRSQDKRHGYASSYVSLTAEMRGLTHPWFLALFLQVQQGFSCLTGPSCGPTGPLGEQVVQNDGHHCYVTGSVLLHWCSSSRPILPLWYDTSAQLLLAPLEFQCDCGSVHPSHVCTHLSNVCCL